MKTAQLSEIHAHDGRRLSRNEATGILLCPQCGSATLEWTDTCRCKSCGTTIRVDDCEILYFEEDHDFDLRFAAEPLDIRKFKNERMLFDSYIDNEVDYLGRLHSAEFVNRHVCHLSGCLENKIVVDLGGGQAPYIDAFKSTPCAYYNVDLSKPCLMKLHHYHDDRFPVVLLHHNVVENLPFADNSVDIVISCEVIEHLNEPEKHLSEINRILKPGGTLSLSTPCASMYFYPHNFLDLRHPEAFRQWFRKINSEKHWSEALTWHPGLRPNVLRSWLEAAGFEIGNHSTTLWYFHAPHHVVWRILKYMDNKNMKIARKMWIPYLAFTEFILHLNIPNIKWAGTRQFIVCKKPAPL